MGRDGATPFCAWGRSAEPSGGGEEESGRHRSRSRSVAEDRQTDAQRRKAPPSKNGRRWWSHDDEARQAGPEGQSFVAHVLDLWVPVKDRGRILGDRGSNVRRIVDAMKHELGHSDSDHGRPPFVQFNEVDGYLDFELELYPPFNNQESFERIEHVFRKSVLELRDSPVQAASRHCLRPKRIQPDDWECPNPMCGNLCFARRKECNLCGTPKPKDADKHKPFVMQNVPDNKFAPEVARPPKHKMHMISTADRLPPLQDGEVSVVWLIPARKRSALLGRGGETIVEIQASTGTRTFVTTEAETRPFDGQDHCIVHVRGLPEGTKAALPMIANHGGGGCLGRDGFEPLLDAVAAALRGQEEGTAVPLAEITSDPEVGRSMAAVRSQMRGAGLRSLLEVLECWPEQFGVQRTGVAGATATLLEAAPEHEDGSGGSGGDAKGAKSSWSSESGWGKESWGGRWEQSSWR